MTVATAMHATAACSPRAAPRLPAPLCRLPRRRTGARARPEQPVRAAPSARTDRDADSPGHRDERARPGRGAQDALRNRGRLRAAVHRDRLVDLARRPPRAAPGSRERGRARTPRRPARTPPPPAREGARAQEDARPAPGAQGAPQALARGWRRVDPVRPHPRLERGVDRLDHLHARPLLLVPLDEVPGRPRRVGAVEHVLDGSRVLLALLAVAPVLLRQLPRLERVLLARLEAVELLLAGEMQEELDEDHPLGGEHPLEVVDLLVAPAPLLGARELLHALDEHAAVPRAVEHRHPAPARQRGPEAPQPVVALLVVARRGELHHADVARVELADEALDRPALAARVPALEQHAHGWADPAVADQPAEHEAERQQPRLRGLEPLGRLLLVQPDGEVQIIEVSHGRFVSRPAGYVFQYAKFQRVEAHPDGRQGPD